jgi:hypothetical protein
MPAPARTSLDDIDGDIEDAYEFGIAPSFMWQTPPTAPDRLRLVYAGQVLTKPAADCGSPGSRR